MTTKGTKSEIGESGPTDKTKASLDSLVDDIVDEPAPASPQEEDLKDEEQPSEESEGGEAETETEEADSKEEEEVIPASKHKKALESMQKRIDQLVAERKSQQEKTQSQARTQEEKLAALSIQELNELRENVDDSILDAKVEAKTEGTDVTAKLNDLKQLKRNIDNTIKHAPQRFQQKQLANLEAMIDEVKELDPNIVNRSGDLWETAKNVYAKMPSLQASETGQAEALAIAAEYYIEKQKFGAGKEQQKSLAKNVTNLKRKTSLASKTRNVDIGTESFKNLRQKAVKGDYSDKLNFIEKLIPDHFFDSP